MILSAIIQLNNECGYTLKMKMIFDYIGETIEIADLFLVISIFSAILKNLSNNKVKIDCSRKNYYISLYNKIHGI